MRRLLILCTGLFISFAVFAGGAAESDSSAAVGKSVTISHKLGEVEVPVEPEFVAVMTLDVVDILGTIGVPVDATLMDFLPTHLRKYVDEGAVNTGSFFEPDFETLYNAAPDVIFISGRTASVYGELSDIAPVVYTTIDPSSYMGSLETNWGIIASLYPSKKSELDDHLASAYAKRDEIVAKAKGIRALFVLVNDGALSAFGPESRVGFVYSDFGFSPADPDIEVSTHGQSVSFEYLAEIDADVVFVLDRAAAIGRGTQANAARTVLDNEIVNSTRAAQNDKIVYLDPHVWYLMPGGIQSTSSIFDDLNSGLE